MEIITDKLIQLDVTLDSKESVINHITSILMSQNRIGDKEKLIEDIYMREEEASTSMGIGIAIPHAKSVAVNQASVVFLRLNRKIDWNTDNDVQMIFGIFVPAQNVDNQHLKILSSLARKLANQEFREELLNVQTQAECEKLLKTLNQNDDSES